ncbi:hypothetical protein [Nocardioides sp.]|uniref:hypothetical protein n=1 Tax=Nocardioides sp. TaxID=35761 RepID=UPI002ED1B61F
MRWVWAAAAVSLLLGGCSLPGGSPEPQPDAEPTTLSSYDAAQARVVRGPFCDRLSPTGVEHALGAVPEDSTQWENGDRVRLPDGTKDRVHEFGCRWSAEDGAVAMAYLFVPPVTKRQARELVQGRLPAGCSPMAANGFGRPNLATRCVGDDATTALTYRGLFGDAWVVCSLRTPGDPADLPTRASAWCVEVLEAARA